MSEDANAPTVETVTKNRIALQLGNAIIDATAATVRAEAAEAQAKAFAERGQEIEKRLAEITATVADLSQANEALKGRSPAPARKRTRR
jgi:hypothetical protein